MPHHPPTLYFEVGGLELSELATPDEHAAQVKRFHDGILSAVDAAYGLHGTAGALDALLWELLTVGQAYRLTGTVDLVEEAGA